MSVYTWGLFGMLWCCFEECAWSPDLPGLQTFLRRAARGPAFDCWQIARMWTSPWSTKEDKVVIMLIRKLSGIDRR